MGAANSDLRHGDTITFTLDFAGGSLLDLLNTIVRSHGRLTWPAQPNQTEHERLGRDEASGITRASPPRARASLIRLHGGCAPQRSRLSLNLIGIENQLPGVPPRTIKETPLPSAVA